MQMWRPPLTVDAGETIGYKTPMRDRRICLVILIVLSAMVVGLVSWIIISRLSYPFELSKMEGGIVDHARRAARGEPIYPPPSADFVPFLYAPLSHYAAGGLIALGLEGFMAARLVSLIGISLAVGIGMWLVARSTSQRWLWAMVPVLVAARYFDVEGFFDQARPDNLMSAFIMIAVAALTLRRRRWIIPLFVAAAVLAFWTKQSALVLLVGLLVGYALMNWRTAIMCAVPSFGLIAISFFLYNHMYDGWPWIYTIDAPSYHTLDHGRLLRALATDLLGSFAIPSLAAGLAAAGLLLSRSRPQPGATDLERTRFMIVVAAVAAGGFAAASRWQPISVRNVLVVFAVASSVALPVVVAWGIEQLRSEKRRGMAWNLALLTFCAAIAGGIRNPASYVPTAEAVAQWRDFRDAAAAYGPRQRVWVSLHGSAFGSGVDDPMHVHIGALFDYAGGRFGEPTGHTIPDDLLERIESQYYEAILVADWDERLQDMLGGRYQPDPAGNAVRIPAFSGYGAAREQFWIPVRGQIPNRLAK